jgi:MFS family permease
VSSDARAPPGDASAPPSPAPRLPRLRELFRSPGYRRLWIAGGLGNAMRWLEMLVAGIFTFDLTGSALAVALVTMARTLPMFVMGSLAGVIADAVNRKALLLAGFVVLAVNSAVLCGLAATHSIALSHIVIGGVIGGTFWSGEMAVRRRMIGEVVEAAHVGQAIALDSMTGSLARMVGPLFGGAIFEIFGLAAAYLLATLFHLLAAVVAARLAYRQEKRRLNLARIPADIAEGMTIVRAKPVLLVVVLITIITNVFGFSYTALVAPIGLHDFAVSPAFVGLLAAAEPCGAMASGLALAAGWLRMDHPRVMIRGSACFFAALAAMSLSPWFAGAVVMLFLGGLGTAAFSSMQSTLVLTHAPPAVRSRVMGLITVSIGTGPIGVFAAGTLSDALGPPRALLAMAVAGIFCLALVWLRWLAVPTRHAAKA